MTGPRVGAFVVGDPTAEDWRNLRERHGLTQQQLADLVHRTVEAIRKWEGGRPGDPACWHLALLLLGEVRIPTLPARRRSPDPA